MFVRCLHCQESVEVSSDGDLRHVTCPSCGGSFNVLGEDTLSWAGQETKRLGPFELVQAVGGGAFGTVWKARDPRLDRTVAIKVPRKGQLEPAEAEQFLREARNAAQLHHPNIVAVHEVGRADDTVYIVSDFVQGVTLDDWLGSHDASLIPIAAHQGTRPHPNVRRGLLVRVTRWHLYGIEYEDKSIRRSPRTRWNSSRLRVAKS